jgi:hypothetical protein
MGVTYTAICRTCKLQRDIDKLRVPNLRTQKEVLENMDEINPYRSALLIGFMSEHEGHNCTLINDTMDYDEDFQHFDRDDRDYWGVTHDT